MTQDAEPAAAPPRSLMDGVDEAACRALGTTGLRHRAAVRSSRGAGAVELAGLVHAVVAGNWIAGGAAGRRDRSRQNWRWTLQPQIGPENRSPEVVLERAAASACVAAGRTDWANQVPVASGLLAGAGGRRRAIDLVQRRGGRAYELIELKVASDTPHYAAIELLGYASLWLLARHDPPAHLPPLLGADRIDLRVLAPAGFYATFDLAGLERSVDEGVRALGRRHAVAMTFGFDVLPPCLAALPLPPGPVLLDALDGRRALHGSDVA